MIQSTRGQIVEILKRRGRARVDDLSKELGITLMAVRLHLVVLERDGLVSRRSVREGPGRPTLVYQLTEQAEEVFPKAYHELAERLLDVLKDELGLAPVEQLCGKAAQRMAGDLRERLGEQDEEQRLAAFVRGEQDHGNLVEWERAENGFLLHIYSCPYFRVARVHREVCVLHSRLLSELFGAKAEMVSCLLDEDGRCSHLLMRAASEPAEAQTATGKNYTQRPASVPSAG